MIGMKETTSNNGFRCPCRPITSSNSNCYHKNIPKQKCFCRNCPTREEESKTEMKCHSKKIQAIKSNITNSNRSESSNMIVRCCTANKNGLGEIEPKINKIKLSCDGKSDAHMMKVIFKTDLLWNFHSQIHLPPVEWKQSMLYWISHKAWV